MDKACETAQAAKDKVSGATQATKDRASDTSQAAGGRAHETKENAGGYMDTAKAKLSETHSARDTAEAGKDKTGGAIQTTTEQVKNAAAGAADAVKNALGMNGNADDSRRS